MSPELKIILYLVFIISLFLIQNISIYIIILIVILLLFFRVPFASLKRGWLPVGFFLLFTFISNMFFNHGRILYSCGWIIITEEGLHIASMRTLRLFFMISGAKILAATTPFNVLVSALGNILRPLEKIGLPVNDFFSTMGLTLKCFPLLKDYLTENYKNWNDENLFKGKLRGGKIGVLLMKAKIISSFLLPLFIQSMQSPEIFFDEKN